MSSEDENECVICYDKITKETGKVLTKCGHTYCPNCFAKHMRQDNSCAYCRAEITEDKPLKENLYEPVPNVSISYTMSTVYPSVFSYLPGMVNNGMTPEFVDTLVSDFDVNFQNNNPPESADEQPESTDNMFLNFINSLGHNGL